MITKNEFAMAWMVAKARISDLPNITFVVEQYIAELEKQNQDFSRALDDAGWEVAKEMEEEGPKS